MYKTRAGRFEFRGPTGGAAWCDLTVYRAPDESAVVVCAESPDNPGISVTNFAGELATVIWYAEGQPAAFSWIEHYPAEARPTYGESFDLVTFRLAGDQLIEGQWQHLSRAAVAGLLAGQGAVDQPDWYSIRVPALILDCTECGGPLGVAEVLAGAQRCGPCARDERPQGRQPDTDQRRAVAEWQTRTSAQQTRLGLTREQRIGLLAALVGPRSLWSLSVAELYALINQVEAFTSADEVAAFLSHHRLENGGRSGLEWEP